MTSPFNNLSEHHSEHEKLADAGLAFTLKSYIFSDAPNPEEYENKQVYFSDIDAMAYSDGVNWTVQWKEDYYIGQVATNCYSHDGMLSGSYSINSRTVHVATENLTQIKPIHANWYTSDGADTGTGNSVSIECAIEYPAGTLTRVTYGGSNVGSIADFENSAPDWVTVNIPKNAVFGVRVWADASIGVVSRTSYYTNFAVTMTEGGGVSTGVLASSVMNTGATYPTNSYIYPCAAIVGYTDKNSCAIFGDSIARGTSDSADYTLKSGFVERSLNCGHINLGVGGESINYPPLGDRFIKRAELAQYCDSIYFGYGINDCSGGYNAQTIVDGINLFFSTYAQGKDIYIATLVPVTTGTWVAAGGTGQTADDSGGFQTKRELMNNLIMTGITRPHKIIPLHLVLGDQYSNRFWKGFADPYQITTDGLHPNKMGNIFAASQLGNLINR